MHFPMLPAVALILLVLHLGVPLYAQTAISPRYQTLADSTAEKKSLLEVVKKPIDQLRRADLTTYDRTKKRNATHRKKGMVSTVIDSAIQREHADLFIPEQMPTNPELSQCRSAAQAAVLFDTPEIEVDTSRFVSLVPADSTSSDTLSDEDAFDGDTTIHEGDLVGFASWYGPGLHGRKTASGERFDMNKMTAAHRTLPFGTIVEVTHLKTGKSVRVKINDRGPHRKDRMIDLSKKAAQKIGITASGYAKVKVKVLQ